LEVVEMTTEYSISVENWTDEKWEMTGREIMYSILSDRNTRQYKELKRQYGDGYDIDTIISEKADEHCPVMLYAYPLYSRPTDEQIVKICEETACTVVEDTETGDFFIALCGGGMDLSQDVAHAYVLAGERVPPALAMNVSTQYTSTCMGRTWRKVMRECRRSLLISVWHYKEHAKKITDAMRAQRQIDKRARCTC